MCTSSLYSAQCHIKMGLARLSTAEWVALSCTTQQCCNLYYLYIYETLSIIDYCNLQRKFLSTNTVVPIIKLIVILKYTEDKLQRWHS